MNRRGFISLLAGAAGAPFVPWRGLLEPTILLPARNVVTLAPLTDHQVRELAVPEDWLVLLQQPRHPVTGQFITHEQLALLEAAAAKRTAFLAARTQRPIITALDYSPRCPFKRIPGFELLRVEFVPYRRSG